MGQLLEEIIESARREPPELHVRILAEEVVSLRDELATAREVIQESAEARRVTEAEGGSLNQANNEIDRLRARVAYLEKQPHANELLALRNLFAAAGRTIHAAACGAPATLEEINDAWAEVCAAHVANRDLPSPDVVLVPREECGWVSDEDPDSGERHWETECGSGWMMISGTPSENDMRFCPMCGKPIALRSGEGGKGGAT